MVGCNSPRRTLIIIPNALKTALKSLKLTPEGDITKKYKIILKGVANERFYVQKKSELLEVIKKVSQYAELCHIIEKKMEEKGLEFQFNGTHMEIVKKSLRTLSNTNSYIYDKEDFLIKFLRTFNPAEPNIQKSAISEEIPLSHRNQNSGDQPTECFVFYPIKSKDNPNECTNCNPSKPKVFQYSVCLPINEDNESNQSYSILTACTLLSNKFFDPCCGSKVVFCSVPPNGTCSSSCFQLHDMTDEIYPFDDVFAPETPPRTKSTPQFAPRNRSYCASCSKLCLCGMYEY